MIMLSGSRAPLRQATCQSLVPPAIARTTATGHFHNQTSGRGVFREPEPTEDNFWGQELANINTFIDPRHFPGLHPTAKVAPRRSTRPLM